MTLKKFKISNRGQTFIFTLRQAKQGTSTLPQKKNKNKKY